MRTRPPILFPLFLLRKIRTEEKFPSLEYEADRDTTGMAHHWEREAYAALVDDTFKYRAGRNNVAADCLSRLRTDENC